MPTIYRETNIVSKAKFDHWRFERTSEWHNRRCYYDLHRPNNSY